MSSLLVAAIDFGTTYSGYAFSFLADHTKDPLKAFTHNWSAGSRALISSKTPTCILFDQGQRFHSFGYEAEDKYSDLSLDDEHHGWYFFKRFKMELYDKMTVKRRFKIHDERGQAMDAITVFSESIKYLKNHMIKTCRDRITGIEDTDIKWVLTVPAIWNDAAKGFMREAAELAGIKKNQLVIALEPEAASLFCRHLPVDKFSGTTKGFTPFKPGSKYLVLDAGGGTVDITVHEVRPSGNLIELYKANGGNWGGTYVDRSFRAFVSEIVGNDVMEIFADEHTADYLDLFREFEVKKRTFNPKMNEKITFKVPIALNDVFKEANSMEIKEFLPSIKKYSDRVTWVGDKIRVEAEIAKSLFDDCCTCITRHLKELFMKPVLKDVSTILMVGGFSDSLMLQDAVSAAMRDKRLVIPAEAGLAVLKGAVIFGHEPTVISERKCRYTYGVACSRAFIEGVHPNEKKFFNDKGEAQCNNLFSKHVETGQTVKLGEPQSDNTYTPVNADDVDVSFPIYASTEDNPTYTTDTSCTLLGTLKTSYTELYGIGRQLRVRMTFSGTEITVESEEVNTGVKKSATFNYID